MAAMAIPIEPASDASEPDRDSELRMVESCAGVLSVSEFQTDHTALRRILDDTPWRLTTAGSCHEAFQKLCRNYPLVVFTDSSLPDGTWKEVLEAIARFKRPYSFLVVTSRQADDRLWSEVLHLGGYDVLSKPLVDEDVRRVLDSVWKRRRPAALRARVLGEGS